MKIGNSQHGEKSIGWFLVLQSEEARQQFDKEDGHDKLKVSLVTRPIADWYMQLWHLLTRDQQEETDPLLEQVFVYDFEEEDNFGW